MLEVMAGSEPGDAYVAPPHDGAFVAACAEDPGPAAHRRAARAARGQPGRGAGRDLRRRRWRRSRAWGTGSTSPTCRWPRCCAPFETIVLGQTRRPAADRAARALGSARAARARGGADGERIGVGEYVPGRGRRAPRHGCGARGARAVRARRLPRAHAAGRAARRVPASTPAAARAGASTSTGIPTPCRTTSPASRRSRCPAARPRRACPVGLQIVGPPGEDALVFALAAALERALRLGAIVHRRRPGRRRGLRADRGRRALGLRARRAPAWRASASATGRTATRAIPRRSTPGCASTRRTRWRPPRAPTSSSASAPAARRAALAVGHPDRPQGSLRRRRRAADRVELACSTSVPTADCDVWARLRAEGMILLGHLHTHEFAVGGTTDQVGNPWALERSSGGSSGGSGAALAARMVPAATGTDTAGSLRIPSALCGTSTIKPTRGLVSLRGVVPLAPSLDHAGPMARTLEDCAPAAGGHGRAIGRPAARSPRPPRRRPRRSRACAAGGRRLALSPGRPVALDADVADGFDARARRLPGARRRARRAASAARAARRRRRLPRRALRGVARLPPPLRRPPRRATARRSGSGSSRREARNVSAERYLAHPAAPRRETTAALRAVARRRAHLGAARADRALRRARCAATATTTPAATTS